MFACSVRVSFPERRCKGDAPNEKKQIDNIQKVGDASDTSVAEGGCCPEQHASFLSIAPRDTGIEQVQ